MKFTFIGLHRLCLSVLPVLSVLASVSAGYAQDTQTRSPDQQAIGVASPFHTGTIIFGASAGEAFGNVGGALINFPQSITYRVNGHHGPGGGLFLGAAITPNFLVVAEASFLDGGRVNTNLGSGYTVESDARSLVYSAFLDYRFHVKTGRAITLFGGIGAATAQARSDVLVNYAAPVPVPGQPLLGALQVRLREAAFAPAVNAGAEWYLKHHLGVRLEARGLLPTGSSHDPFGDVTLGVFVLFGRL